MPVILDESRHVLSHTPFLLWKSIDPLIMVVVTPLVAVARWTSNPATPSLPSQDDHRNGLPHHPHTSTAVLGLALVQYHLPFNTVADLDLLCVASIVVILVIQTKSKDGTDAVPPVGHLGWGRNDRRLRHPTKCINRPCTEMGATPHFGARLTFSTSKSTSSVTLLTLIHAIRINPYISEVWFDLGSLYENCNNLALFLLDSRDRP